MTGLDIAPTFLRHARETEAADPMGIDYVLGDGVHLEFADESFDFVTAFMSLMDMADQAQVLADVRRVLKPGGFLQFSILHPCFVPPTRRNIRNAEGDAVAVEIADYFDETDGRIERWIFSAIPKEERAGCASSPFRASPHVDELGGDGGGRRTEHRSLWRADGLGGGGAGRAGGRRHAGGADLSACSGTAGLGRVVHTPPALGDGRCTVRSARHEVDSLPY